jgi:tryptophan-rich sensory protein
MVSGYLPLSHSWAWALAACVIAAVLEGVLSGRRVRQRFAELQLPQRALPLWAWSIVGLAYYVLFFLLLNSLLGGSSTAIWTAVALALVAVLLGANASWNWVFFQKKDLWLSFMLFVPYILAAFALAVVLFRLRSPLATWFLLYVGYLGYATWWGYRIWRLNGS